MCQPSRHLLAGAALLVHQLSSPLLQSDTVSASNERGPIELRHVSGLRTLAIIDLCLLSYGLLTFVLVQNKLREMASLMSCYHATLERPSTNSAHHESGLSDDSIHHAIQPAADSAYAGRLLAELSRMHKQLMQSQRQAQALHREVKLLTKLRYRRPTANGNVAASAPQPMEGLQEIIHDLRSRTEGSCVQQQPPSAARDQPSSQLQAALHTAAQQREEDGRIILQQQLELRELRQQAGAVRHECLHQLNAMQQRLSVAEEKWAAAVQQSQQDEATAQQQASDMQPLQQLLTQAERRHAAEKEQLQQQIVHAQQQAEADEKRAAEAQLQQLLTMQSQTKQLQQQLQAVTQQCTTGERKCRGVAVGNSKPEILHQAVSAKPARTAAPGHGLHHLAPPHLSNISHAAELARMPSTPSALRQASSAEVGYSTASRLSVRRYQAQARANAASCALATERHESLVVSEGQPAAEAASTMTKLRTTLRQAGLWLQGQGYTRAALDITPQVLQ